MKYFSMALVALVFAVLAHAQDENWRDVCRRPSLEALRPVNAATILAVPDEPSPDTCAAEAVALPSAPDDFTVPELVALAHALSDDALQIFNFVRNTIAYEHYYGSKKGAVLTLLERSGNDLDQCALLVALLKAAGLSPRYVTGTQLIPYDDAASWLGLSPAAFPNLTWTQAYSSWGYSSDPFAAQDFDDTQKKRLFAAVLFCTNRGWADGTAAVTEDGRLALRRTWVSVSVGTVAAVLDPSFKLTTSSAPLDVAASSGYSRVDLLVAAGGTSNGSSTSVRGIDESALGAHLAARAAQLRTSVRDSAQPHRSIDELLGRPRLVPVDSVALPTATLYPATGTSSAASIASSAQVKLTVQLGGGSAVTRAFSTLGGECLSLTFSGNTATLHLGDAVLTTATVTGSTVNLRTSISYPNSYGNSDRTLAYAKGDDSAYALIYAFSPNGLHLRQRQHLLDGYLRKAKALPGVTFDTAGNLLLTSTPDATLRRHLVTESLNVLGLGWAYHSELAARMMAEQHGVDPVRCHLFGRAAQEQKNGVAAGCYVDLAQNCSSLFSRDGRSAPKDLLMKAGAFFLSALEHAEIEQMQSGTKAVSTVKILALANRATGDTSRDEIFRVDASNVATVRPLLRGYTTAFLDTMQTDVASNEATYLLPENASTPLDAWTGFGYAVCKPNGIGMIISGGLNGGFSSTSAPVNSSYTDTITTVPGYYVGGDGLVGGISYSPNFNTSIVTSWDPVDMNSGAFLLASRDIALGESGTRGVAFERSYSSANRDADPVGLGWGWNHNLNMMAAVRSAPEASLGETTAFDASPMLVTTRIVADLFEGSSAREWAVAALSAGWAIDQIKDNAVAIVLGTDALQFLRLPEGTFQAPAKSTLTLTKEPGTGDYLMQERLGATFRFAAAESYRCTRVTDFDGNASTLTYSAGQLTSVTDHVGRALTLRYTDGRLSSVTDNGTPARSVSFTVGADALLAAVTDVGGQSWRYDYGETGTDAERRIVRTRDPLDRTIVENDYGADGRVSKQRNQGLADREYTLRYTGFANTEIGPTGAVTTYFYDSRGRTEGVRDPDGNRTAQTYDGQDQVVTRTSARGYTTSFAYDRHFNLVSVTDPLGAKTINHYDTLQRLWKIEQIDPAYPDPENSDPDTIDRTTLFEFAGGNLSPRPDATVDPRGVRTEFTYEPASSAAAGKPTTSVRKSAHGDRTARYYYDTRGLPQRVETPARGGGVETSSVVHDWRGQLESTTDARGFTTTFTYNARGQVLTATGPGDAPDYTASVTRTFYDSCGNPVLSVDATDRATKSTFSTTGKVLQVEQGLYNGDLTAPGLLEAGRAVVAVNHYNSLDQLVKTDGPLAGQSSDFTYTAAGRLESVTDALRRTVLTTYNADGQPETVTSPLVESTPRTTRQQYNERGQPSLATDARGQESTTSFNAWGERLSLTNRRGKIFSFTYCENGLPQGLTTPLGKTLTRTYNDRNLPETVQTPSGRTTTFVYDAADRIETATDPAGTIGFTYDAQGRPLTVTEGSSSLARTFDPFGRVKTYTDSRGDTVTYRYFANGLLKRLVYPGSPARAIDYTYDELNRLATVVDWSGRTTVFTYRADGLLTQLRRPNGSTRELTYDLAGQLLRIEERKPSGEIHTFLHFGFDAGGRIAWRSELPRPTVSPAEPLAPMTYDEDNRLATWSGQAIGNDDDGNMTRGPLASGELGDYMYDARSRLVSADSVTSAYDAEGNRIAQTSADGTTQYTIDPHGGPLPQVLVRERPDGSQVLYVHAGGVLLYEVEAATDAPRYYHGDQVGNTVALSDAAGAITDRIAYTPYGSIVHRTGTSDTPYLFGGLLGCATDSNGLVHMRARFYHPKLARFLNADPSGFAGGTNWYAYASGNPVALSDPSGLDSSRASELTYLAASFDGAADRMNERLGSEFVMAPYFGASDGECMRFDGTGYVTLDQHLRREYVNAALKDAVLEVGFMLVTHRLFGLLGTPARALRATTSAGSGAARLPADIAATFRNGSYRSRVLQSDVEAFRFSGGSAEPAGRFLTTRQTVLDIATPGEARAALNLPMGATATELNTFVIPKGTRIFYGRVEGGGASATQIFIENKGVLVPVP